MDPSERLTCEQLLLHPYFDSLREKSESSSQEQDRSRRMRFPRKHHPPGVKQSAGSRPVFNRRPLIFGIIATTAVL